MYNKKISVIIPSYNHSKFLKKAIDSVLNQSYKDFELIILDDCSTDNSVKIINSYQDKRIKKYFNEKNSGAVNTLNQLINMATGEYIALLNSDDYWDEKKLEIQIEYLENNPSVAACFTWTDFVDEHNKGIFDSEIVPLDLFQKGNLTQSEWLKFLFDNGNCLCHPSVMIRSKIYNEIGMYKNIFRQLPDFEFWIRLIKKYNIHIIEQNLTHFRILSKEGTNSSHLNECNKNLMNYEMYVIKEKFLDDCNDHLFYEAFKDQIINKQCINNSVMLEFEKCIILYDSRYYNQIGRLIGYKRLGELLLDSKTAHLLEKKYLFTEKDLFSLGEKITPLDVQYFEYQIIEKIPEYILNSRMYRWSNKIYQTKAYDALLKMRRRLRKRKKH